MSVKSIIIKCVITIALFSMPILSSAACLDSDKTLRTIGELQQVLICLEKKLDSAGGSGESVLVNYLPELAKPTISKEVYAGEVKFGLKQCEHRGSDVKCEFTVRNEAKDVMVKPWADRTFAVDEFGKKYERTQIDIGGGAGRKLLITKVPVEGFVIFKEVDQTSTRFARFDFSISIGSNLHTMEFRDVALR